MNGFDIVRLTTCTLLLALSGTATPAAAEASAFDGAWKVRIITQRGACDSGRSLPIRVSNGTIASDQPVVKVSGQVGSSGNLNVSVGDGLRRASGVGHLSDTTGAGTWKGGPCSGIWTAEKI